MSGSVLTVLKARHQRLVVPWQTTVQQCAPQVGQEHLELALNARLAHSKRQLGVPPVWRVLPTRTALSQASRHVNAMQVSLVPTAIARFALQANSKQRRGLKLAKIAMLASIHELSVPTQTYARRVRLASTRQPRVSTPNATTARPASTRQRPGPRRATTVRRANTRCRREMVRAKTVEQAHTLLQSRLQMRVRA